MNKKKFIFLTCVILLLISCISAISAKDLDSSSNISVNDIIDDSTHAMENVQQKNNDNSYNSGLDTSESATTNIGENNTSQNSETNTYTTNTTNTINSTKTINRKTSTNNVKTATEVTVSNWNELYNAITSCSEKDLIINLNPDIEYKITYNVNLGSALSVKNLTINGNGATINGQNQYRLFYVQGNKAAGTNFTINLTDINFVNCGKMGMSDSHGGVILSYQAPTIYVSKCNFINCSANSGGAFFLKNEGKLYINDSTFINSYANNGGSISVESDSILVVKNVSFINSTSNDNAGAVLCKDGWINITDSTFDNCNITGTRTSTTTSTIQFGGSAIHMCSYTEMYIVNNTFTNNYAYGEGTVYIHKQLELTLDKGILANNTFVNNTSPRGSGVIIHDCEDILVENNTFINNTATGSVGLDYESMGGAVYIGNNTKVTLNNNTFENNYAEKGGAIYSEKDHIISNSTFKNNNATTGGAIYLDSNVITISDSNFDNNTAITGGAIYTNGKITSNNNNYTNNNATDGGVLYIDSSQSSLTSTNDNFNNNTAITGIIDNYHGTISIDNATIINNNATIGSVIYNDRGTLKLNNSQINNNTAENATIYNTHAGTVVLSNNNITNNTAKESSIIYNEGTATITENNITNNIVTDTESFVIYNKDGTITVTKNNFTNNTDYTRDMLLGSNNDKYTVTDNYYLGNYLKTSFTLYDDSINNEEDEIQTTTIKLRDIYNSKVTEGNLTIYLNDNTEPLRTFTVNEDGIVTIQIEDTNILKDRNNTVKAVYSTTTKSYQNSETTFIITPFTDTNITITTSAEDDIYVVNKTINYTIHLMDYHGNPLNSTKINVTVNGTGPTEYTTDDDGNVTISIVYDANGDKTIRVQYLGDDFYNHATKEYTHYVRKINTKVSVKLPTGIAPKDDVQLNITLEDEYGNTIPNKNVTIRILNSSSPVYVDEVTVDENGYNETLFTPQYQSNYEVEIIFKDENDSVHNYSIVKVSLPVNRIPTDTTLFNTTKTFEDTITGFEVILFERDTDTPISGAYLHVNVTITSGDLAGRIITYDTPITNATGYYSFTFERKEVTDNFTVSISYDGDERFYPTSFTKPFNGANIFIMNITATDTFVYHNNSFYMSIVDYHTRLPINGTFYITTEQNHEESSIIASTPVIDGKGYINDTIFNEYGEKYVYGSFYNETYIIVFQQLNFQVNKIPTRINVTVLNETVYNTTLAIDLTVPFDEYPELNQSLDYTINGLNITVKHKNGNIVESLGSAEVVDGKVTIQLENVDRNKAYDLIIDYDGNDYYLGREHEIKVTPQKLPVTLTPIIVNNEARNVTLRVNVTSDYDPSVDNGTVSIYLDSTGDLIGTGRVRDGYAIIEFGSEYFEYIGTHSIDIRYNNSETFKDTSLDYDLKVVGRPSAITPTVNNTVIHNVTADVVLRDAKTGEILANRNITAYNSKMQVIGKGTTDENGFVTILLNLTQTGPHIVNFTFTGNRTYTGSSALLPINVEYRNASIKEEILNNTRDNVTIKVNLTDKDNNQPISKGDIAVLYKDGQPIAEGTTDENGIVIFEGLDIPAGNNTLIVKLLNDGTYDDTPHEITVNVDYRNMTVTFVQDNPYVTESTIIVTLKDNNTENLVEGSVEVYDSQGYVIGRGNADYNGIFINLPAGTHIITVVYPEGKNYNRTETTGSVTIIKYNTTLSVEANVTSTTLGNSVKISGTLTSGNVEDRLLFNKTVIIYVDNSPIGVVKTDYDGNYEFNYTTVKVGEMIINASFEEDNYYLSSVANNSFNVTKMPTNTTASVISSVIGNVVLSVDVTDVNGNNVPNGTVKVYLGNVEIANSTVVNGKSTVTITSDLSVGENYIVVEYQEDMNYLASNATNNTERTEAENTTFVNVTKKSTSILIFIDDNNLIIGQNVTIRGIVLDNQGKPVTSGKVNITINGTDYQVDLNGAMYVLSNITSAAGTYDVNATFLGTSELDNVTSETLQFTVNKIDTVTNVSIINNTAGNVIIEVSVTNTSNQPVTGKINVTFEDGTIIVSEYPIDGKVNVTIPTTSDATLRINVTFLEDDTYYSSKGVDATSSDENVTIITVNKQVPTIIIKLDNDNLTIGQKVNITVNVTDAMGNSITKDVNVTIDGENYTATYDSNTGLFNVTNITVKAGTFKVNATYLGNDTVSSLTSETLNFTVNKIATITNVEVISSLINNVTIRVNVTNNTDIESLIKTGNLNITLVNGTVLESEYPLDATEGYVDIVLTDLGSAGTYYINVAYNENDVYLSSSAMNDSMDFITVNVEKIPTITNVTILDATIGNVTLAINVTNTTDFAFVKDGALMVTDSVNHGKVYGYSAFVGEGKIELVLDGIHSAGTYNVMVSYIGTEIYGDSLGTDSTDSPIITFTVNKINTNTSVNILDNSLDNVVLAINVTNSTGELVTQGRIIVRNASNPEQILANDTLDNGRRNVTLTDVTSTGLLEVTVEYVENDIYNASVAANNTERTDGKNIVSITVEVDPNITISIENNTVFVGQNVTINGTVYNSTEGAYLLDGAKVNVTINGENYQATYDSLTGKYNLTIDATAVNGTYTFNATFIDAENNIIVTSESLTYTVSKIATITSVTVLNNTYSNVTIRVSVTNNTDTEVNLTVGNITVYDNNGNLLAFEKVIDSDSGYVDIKLNNITEVSDLKIKVIYNENDKYLSSNAVNESAFDRDYFIINVDKMQTITNIESLLNNKVDNVTLTINVTNSTGEALNSGRVEVIDATTGELLGEGTLDSEGKVNITLTKEFEAGNITVNVTYTGDDYYYSSRALGNTTDLDYTTTIRVIGSPNITISLDTDNVIIKENVTVKVNVTDDLGSQITSDITVNVTINNTNYTAVYNSSSGFHELQYNTTEAGLFVVNATYTEANLTSTTLTFTVDKIPTTSNVTVISNVAGNVTLNISVADKYDEIIKDGIINITIAGNTIPVELSGEDYTIVNLKNNITSVGDVKVTVEYTGNDIYLASIANNTADDKQLENITVTNCDAIITVSVNTTNTTIGYNVTINGTLVDVLGNNITDAYVIVLVDGVAIPVKTDNTGSYTLNYTTVKVGNMTVNATFDGRNNYNPVYNVTSFNVTQIPTKTNVTLVNSTIGNVVIHVNVTNMTDDAVKYGHVVVRNQTGDIIGEGELVNGGVDITLNVSTPETINVNVTYVGDLTYMPSNGRNSTISDENDPNINITSINVVKQEADISINLNPEIVVIGDNVYIRGSVTVDGTILTAGKVNITVNNTNTTVDINSDGSYNLTYNAIKSGEYTVNATYLGNENISSITSENKEFTVKKIETVTSVKIINSTIGHVQIEVTVTDISGSPLSTGIVNVYNATNSSIVNATPVDGKILFDIPSNAMDTLSINVSYLENDVYYSSNAVNTTGGVASEDENITFISISKIDSLISIDVNDTVLTIGESVKILVNVTDTDGNQITDIDDITIYIDGNAVAKEEISVVDGNFTVNNITVSAGTFIVNATYAGNTSVNGITSSNVEYVVDKIATTTNVTILNDTSNNVTVNITVKGADGKIVTGIVNLSVGGVTTPVVVSGEGEVIKLNITETGEISVNAKYTGDDKYYPSDAFNTKDNTLLTNITVTKQVANINVTVNNSTPYIGDEVYITGNLTNSTGEYIVNVSVIINVYGQDYIVTTNTTGGFNLTVKADTLETTTITAKFNTNTSYENVNDTEEFTTGKLPTNTTVAILNNTIGNVTLTVNVTDVYNRNVTNGTVNIYLKTDLENPIATATVVNGVVNEIKVPVTSTGDCELVVTYIEDVNYLASNATNNTETHGDNITYINVVKQNANITIKLDKNNVTIGESIYITGTVTVDGKIITSGTVTVNINGTTNIIDVVNGVYNLTNITITSGTYNVNATFENENINSITSETLSFTVNKIPTNTIIEVTNSTYGNVTVVVDVTNSTGAPVNTGNVNLTYSDGTQIEVKAVENGKVEFIISNTGLNDIKVNASYIANNIYDASVARGVNAPEGMENTTTITVQALEPVITISADKDSVVLGESITINGTITNETGEPVPVGIIVTVTIGGDEYPVTVTEAGKYTITNITSSIGVITANVTYNGKTSDNVEYTVDKIPTTTNVTLLNATAGNVTIDIIVKGNNSIIKEGNVTLTVNGKEINITLSGEENTTVNLNITSSGTSQVTVEYKGNNTFSSSIGNNTKDDKGVFTNITVDKQNVNITVSANNTKPRVGDNVNITGNLTDDMGNKLANTTVIITINGTDYTTKTNEAGEYNLTYTPTSVGEIKITARFEENSTYNSNTGDEEVVLNVGKILTNITVSATPNNTTVGKIVTINGILTDENNNTLADSMVSIKLNDDEYFTKTDSEGKYSITNITIEEGTVNVLVSYIGTSSLNASNNQTSFKVNKTATKTLVTLVNSTIGNVNINVEVFDNETKVVTTGELEISSPDFETFKVPVTGNVTNIKLNFTTNGTHTVNVKYLNNTVYINSTGLDNSTYPSQEVEFNEITVNKLNTTISLNSITAVKVGNNTNITGKLVDSEGKPVEGATIKVTLEGEEPVTVTTDKEGNYNVTIKTSTVGDKKVTAEFEGNSVYANSTANTIVEVKQVEATINTVVPSDAKADKNTTINGTVTDEFGNPVSGVPVNITVNGKNYNTTTQTDGTYSITVDNVVPGQNNVTVASGNDNITTKNVMDKFFVNKEDVNLTVDTIEPILVGDNVTINGKLIDTEGKAIPNAKVNITVGNTTKVVTTDAQGNYNASFATSSVGVLPVKVSYNGSDKYNSAIDYDNINVIQNTGNLEVDTPENVKAGDSVNITGKITDDDGNPISNVPVTVNINGVDYNTTTGTDGKFNIPVDDLETGLNNITVTAGNSTTKIEPVNDKINVIKKDTSLTIDSISDVLVGNKVTIKGKLVDENDKTLSQVNVTVNVDGKSKVVQTDKNGNYEITFDTSSLGGKIVTVDYDGDDNYNKAHADSVFTVIEPEKIKQNTTLTLDTIEDVVKGNNVNITGKLTDNNTNPISGAIITVSVNGTNKTVKTDKKGEYTVTFPTDTIGTSLVRVEYYGNDSYEDSHNSGLLNVIKETGNVTVNVPSDVKIGESVNITGKVTDSKGKPLKNKIVKVHVNGKTYETTTDENGEYSVPVDNLVVGNNEVTVSIGDDEIEIKPVDDNFNVSKGDAKIIVDPINSKYVGDNATITGKVVDSNGKPISNESITIKVNNETYTVTTDENGNYELVMPVNTVGMNNVTVTFENDDYNKATQKSTFKLVKHTTRVVVDEVVGVIGENITLVAHVYDEKGNAVTGGNLVFKLNGRSLRTDGRFDTNNTSPMKLSVVNGIVKFTMKADLYLRSGKNITASYSGSYKYEAAKSNVAEANIKKRNAEIEVKIVPNPTKQDSDIIFAITVRDVTKNAVNTTCVVDNANIILKLNGKTLKNEDGTGIYVPLTSSFITYTYHVPKGMAGMYNNGTMRNYTVTAVYNNTLFYPDTKNSSEFNVERSSVDINFNSVKVKNNILSIKANFTDYKNNLLVGNNTICVKINGKTYQENGKAVYFNVVNGKVDLNGIKIAKGTQVKSVTLVTGQRQAYLGARETTTNILTS